VPPRSGLNPALSIAVLLFIISGLTLAAVALAYVSLQPVVEELGNWISERDANLTRLGIDPNQSEGDIADALTDKLMDDPRLLDQSQLSLERRSSIYDQVEDRPVLAAGCYLLAFKSPPDTAAVLAESGLFIAFWPALILVVLLVAGGVATILRRGRGGRDSANAGIDAV